MKKKLLFTAYSLDIGGIETALINLLKQLDYKKYDVTLILEKKEGIFLSEVPKQVEVLEYKISNSKIVPLRKIYNRSKLIKWSNKIKNKYDFACCYATYSRPGAKLALAASSNSALWVHNNYHIIYPDDSDLKTFFDGVEANRFKHIVFVSNESKKEVCKHYCCLKDKSIVCNNIINGKKIIDLAKEKIDDFEHEVPTFINVGRHDEGQKRLSRIIEASKKLSDKGYEFKVLFVGEGPDTNKYKEMVEDYNLEGKITFLGKKKNPYPYYKAADAVLLSSEYEGYPVVFIESMIMNKPILSTTVSDYEPLVNKYGVFCKKNANDIYYMMRDYLDKGFKIKKPFDYDEYNNDIMEKLDNIINEVK